MSAAEVAEFRLCGCGCGKPVRSPYAVYAPGHYARVGPKDEAGRLVASREAGRCQCSPDCAASVATPGAKYARGHFGKTAEGKAAVGAPKVGEWRTCRCDKKVWVRDCESAAWRACSRRCLDQLKERAWLETRAWNPLQRRLLERLRGEDLLLREVADRLGLKTMLLRTWFNFRDRAISEAALRVVAEFLGLDYDRSLGLAGGKTAEQRRREVGEANRAYVDPEDPDERARLLQAAVAGLRKRDREKGRAPRSQETKEKLSAARLLEGSAAQAGLARMRRWLETPNGRAHRSLNVYLRHHPSPTKAEIAAFAGRTAERLGLKSGEAVLKIWRERLEERDLWGRGGRGHNAARCKALGFLAIEFGWTPAGRQPHGLWKRLAAEAAVRGLDAPLDGPAMLRWAWDHTEHWAVLYLTARAG